MATYTDLYAVLMSFSAPGCRAQIGEFIHKMSFEKTCRKA